VRGGARAAAPTGTGVDPGSVTPARAAGPCLARPAGAAKIGNTARAAAVRSAAAPDQPGRQSDRPDQFRDIDWHARIFHETRARVNG
jgi:hypothetical protein